MMTSQSAPLANNNSQNLKHSSKMDLATTTTILKIIFSNQVFDECLSSFEGFYFHWRATNATTTQQQTATNGECLSSFQCFRCIEGHWKSIFEECLNYFQGFGVSQTVLKINYWGMLSLISMFFIFNMAKSLSRDSFPGPLKSAPGCRRLKNGIFYIDYMKNLINLGPHA